jgi:hypothetical protein
MPATIIYGYFMIAAFAILVILNKMLTNKDFYVVSESEVVNAIKFEIGLRLLHILMMQTLFNYMYLFYKYQAPTWDEYVGVIVDEYHLRTQTYCALESIDTDLRNLLVFLSWI